MFEFTKDLGHGEKVVDINLYDAFREIIMSDDGIKYLNQISKEANELIQYFDFSQVKDYIINRLIYGLDKKDAANSSLRPSFYRPYANFRRSKDD